MKRFSLVAILLIILNVFNASSVLASVSSTPVYITTSTPSAIMTQSNYMQANTSSPDTFNYVYVAWKMYTGDSCGIRWYDSSGTFISETLVDASSGGLVSGGTGWNPPSGSVSCQLTIHTGSSSGTRFVWFTEVANMLGGDVTYPAPDTSAYVPPSPPTTTCTL